MVKPRTSYPIGFMLAMLILLASCSKHIHPGHEVLLKKNRIIIDNSRISATDVQGFILQKPSKKLFGSIKLNEKVYNFANRGKSTGFKNWLNRAMVEKPVYLDTLLCNQALRQISLYLNNIGYFNPNVNYRVNYTSKKAKAIYSLKTGLPYTFRNITFQVNDTIIDRILSRDEANRLIKPGSIYNAYTLDEERTRITRLMKNKGYFYFSKEFINYRIDSALKTRQMDLKVVINNPKIMSGTGESKPVEMKHRTYHIRNVYIYPDFNPLVLDTLPADTLIIESGRKMSDGHYPKYHFVVHGPLMSKPNIITNCVFTSPGDLFNMDDMDQTYNRLSELQFFRYVNIDFRDPAKDSVGIPDSLRYLDCIIQLSRSRVHSVSIGTEGTNTGGDFGVSANVTYQNRNLFKGAELFSLRLKGAMEIQHRFGNIYYTNDKRLFNTFELGAQASLVFPKFLLPIKPERFSKYFKPKTTVNMGFDFQERMSFRRYLMESTFGYEWRQSRTQRHVFNPIELSSVRIFPDSAFTHYLDSINDSKLTDQYSDHLILAMKYSYVYNDQQLNKRTNFFYFRADFESAGNLLNSINQMAGSKKDDNGQYNLWGIRFAQYLKTNFDFRLYKSVGPTTLVYRASAGIGVPYGNSKALPFDKGFYSGGANGMRGWAIRSLGPGAYNDANTQLKSERMGDILMETNFEFRFPISSIIKGAVFGDAGNVWLLKPSDQFPGGEFRGDLFFKQVALDAGLGLRFDFTFFIFRFDGALPIRKPALPEANRWISVGKTSWSDIMWNFGIGYPF